MSAQGLGDTEIFSLESLPPQESPTNIFPSGKRRMISDGGFHWQEGMLAKKLGRSK